jgi:hypothetical protein
MSIQNTRNSAIFNTIVHKLGIIKVKVAISYSIQVLSRLFTTNTPKVFFRYYNQSHTHPSFYRFYKYPPVKWCLRSKADILHWINFPDIIDNRPFVLESNDHPLSAAGLSQPGEVLKNMNKAIDIYLHPSCKKIIAGYKGEFDLFQNYCPQNVLNKLVLLPILPAIPKAIDWINRSCDLSNPVFLCLASDYISKGVDLLIDAWLNVPERNNGQLIIVCSNIPEYVIEQVRGEKIRVISKPLLTEREKDDLHRMAHVAIGPQHIDGGANMVEAMEWGLPIITMRTHRSDSLLRNDNGFLVDVPFYFYDIEYYGTRWKTFEEFFKVLAESKINSEFDSAAEELTKHIRHFFIYPEDIITIGKKSYELACGDMSYRNRNSKLMQIYKEIKITE